MFGPCLAQGSHRRLNFHWSTNCVWLVSRFDTQAFLRLLVRFLVDDFLLYFDFFSVMVDCGIHFFFIDYFFSISFPWWFVCFGISAMLINFCPNWVLLLVFRWCGFRIILLFLMSCSHNCYYCHAVSLGRFLFLMYDAALNRSLNGFFWSRLSISKRSWHTLYLVWDMIYSFYRYPANHYSTLIVVRSMNGHHVNHLSSLMHSYMEVSFHALCVLLTRMVMVCGFRLLGKHIKWDFSRFIVILLSWLLMFSLFVVY